MVIREPSKAPPRPANVWWSAVVVLAIVYLFVAAPLLGARGGCIHIRNYPIFDDGGTLAVPADPDDPRWRDPTGAPGSIAFRSIVRRPGFFAPTRERREVLILRITMYDGSTPTPAQESSIRASLADLLDATGHHPFDGGVLRGGPTSVSRVLWSGYVINALVFPALAVVGVSLWRGVRSGIVSPWIEDIRQGRTARGLCPRCCYDVSAVASPVCPECGEVIVGVVGNGPATLRE